jgi:hypothetical protein
MIINGSALCKRGGVLNYLSVLLEGPVAQESVVDSALLRSNFRPFKPAFLYTSCTQRLTGTPHMTSESPSGWRSDRNRHPTPSVNTWRQGRSYFPQRRSWPVTALDYPTYRDLPMYFAVAAITGAACREIEKLLQG